MVGPDLLTAPHFCWPCYFLNLPSLCHHVAAWVCSFGRMRWPQSEECLRVSGFGFLKLGWQGEQTRDVVSTLRWNQFLKNMVRVLWIVGRKLRLTFNSATFSLGAGFSLYVDVLFSNLGFQPQPYIEVVIVDLLLLNMVLAILMDAYQVAWLNIPKGLATLTSVKTCGTWDSRKWRARPAWWPRCHIRFLKSYDAVAWNARRSASGAERLQSEKHVHISEGFVSARRASQLFANCGSQCLVAFCFRRAGCHLQLPSSHFHNLSKVRLSDIWYAYMEKYRTVDEMLESKVPSLVVLHWEFKIFASWEPNVGNDGICQTESLLIRSVDAAVQHLTTCEINQRTGELFASKGYGIDENATIAPFSSCHVCQQMVRPEDIVKHVPNLTVSQARRSLHEGKGISADALITVAILQTKLGIEINA